MWPFSKKKTVAAPAPQSRLQAAPAVVEIKRLAVREAISSLGLIKPETEDKIIGFLVDKMGNHPEQTLTDYRKGEQLTKEEKKAIGLRSNAFMSRHAFEDLTEAGLQCPLKAHETVLLRVTFTLLRYKALEHLKASGIATDKSFKGVKYDVLKTDCPVCGPLDGTTIRIDQAPVLPLKGCTCDTANFSYRPDIDFLEAWRT